ncbi:cytochrome c oxidase assembly protein COX20, mitochondrial isoform X1 [Caloenas nicobarica]
MKTNSHTIPNKRINSRKMCRCYYSALTLTLTHVILRPFCCTFSLLLVVPTWICKDVCQSFKLLGFLDVQSVPCARESVLYGSLGSLVVGLGHFLATSRVRRSCDFAVGGFICTMLGYWFYCRYNLAQQRIRQRMLKEGMRNKILFEGSSLDPERKQTGNERSNS